MPNNTILARSLQDNANNLFDLSLARTIFTQEVLNDACIVDNNEANVAASCLPPVCTNVPNSSLGSHPELDLQLTFNLDLHGARVDLPTVTSPPVIDNCLVVIAHQSSDNETNDIYTTIERYFSVSGNIYQFGQDWIVRLHERLNDSPFTGTPSAPVVLGQLFYIGFLSFYLDEQGRLHSVVDRSVPLEPKAVFSTADEVWASLYLADGLPTPPLSITSDEGETGGDFGSPVSSLGTDVGNIPLFSPVSSESNILESSIESDLSCTSLFSDIGSDSGVTVRAPSPTVSTSPPNPPPTSTSNARPTAVDELILAPDRNTATKAEIDEYADKIKRLRLSRKGSNQVQIGCPWCLWVNKRSSHPSELKEHMYSHRGFAEFSCPAEGCKHVSNRRSNLTRHLGKHHPALAAEQKAKRLKRTLS